MYKMQMDRILTEQDFDYNETLRIDKEREEQFLREAFAIPKVSKEDSKEDLKEDPKEDPKLTVAELRNARIQFYEKKIELNK